MLSSTRSGPGAVHRRPKASRAYSLSALLSGCRAADAVRQGSLCRRARVRRARTMPVAEERWCGVRLRRARTTAQAGPPRRRQAVRAGRQARAAPRGGVGVHHGAEAKLTGTVDPPQGAWRFMPGPFNVCLCACMYLSMRLSAKLEDIDRRFADQGRGRTAHHSHLQRVHDSPGCLGAGLPRLRCARGPL